MYTPFGSPCSCSSAGWHWAIGRNPLHFVVMPSVSELSVIRYMSEIDNFITSLFDVFMLNWHENANFERGCWGQLCCECAGRGRRGATTQVDEDAHLRRSLQRMKGIDAFLDSLLFMVSKDVFRLQWCFEMIKGLRSHGLKFEGRRGW